MKRIISLLLFFICCFSPVIYAQVGIGTTNPHASSMLDVQATDKGILVPRVSLSSTSVQAPVTNPAEGLLIYNTSTTSDVTPGFYYWTGLGWKSLLTSGGGGGGAEGWGLRGNIVSDDDFIGTLQNYKPLKFRIDDRYFGQFHPQGGISLGLNAVANNDNGIALGENSNAGTSNSIAVGTDASTSTSNLSIAIGNLAVASNHESVALGNNAKSPGHSAISLGVDTNASGEGSAALGREASASGNFSTAIGYGATVSQPNTIRLGNNDAKVGIGTSTPHVSSVLDISATNKGILIPRVALTSTTDQETITQLAVSLLVYNTNTASDVTPGFYYWTGTAWKALVSSGGGGGSAGWGLSGNNVVGTDFLGTTNYQPIRFIVNNSSYGQMHPGGGVAFGNGAAANNNNSIALGTAAASTVSGEAVAIGPSANASGYRSQALGFTAAASNNSALALGNNATASGQNSTALGTGAVASQMNAVVLGNVSNANVGIGTSTPNTNAKLDVNGQFKLGAKGTVQKGVSSFKINGESIEAFGRNNSLTKVIQIPAAARPTSTQATIIITPAYGLDDNLTYFPKLKSTSELSITFFSTNANFPGQTSDFYVTIIEF